MRRIIALCDEGRRVGGDGADVALGRAWDLMCRVSGSDFRKMRAVARMGAKGSSESWSWVRGMGLLRSRVARSAERCSARKR
jgi:hypothetical protein